MTIQKTIEYAKAFAVIPFFATSLTFGSFANTISLSSAATAISNVVAYSSEDKAEEAIEVERLEKAEKIDAYYAKRNLPLEGYGMKMVVEAEKNGLDWRLLAAISVRESTGGKFACKSKPNNPFGWGSCKIGFDTMDDAIETVGRNLGGNNPNTAFHYADKTTEEILKAYNPPSIVAEYAPQVIAIMDAIEEGK